MYSTIENGKWKKPRGISNTFIARKQVTSDGHQKLLKCSLTATTFSTIL